MSDAWENEPDTLDMEELSRILRALTEPDADFEELGVRLQQLVTVPSRAAWVTHVMARFSALLLLESIGIENAVFELRYGDLGFPEREFAQAVNCIMNGDEVMARDIVINAASHSAEAAGDMLGFAMGYVHVAGQGPGEL